jgi:hypothetical protein
VREPAFTRLSDLDFRSEQGARASTSWNFICWVEIRNPGIDVNFTLAGDYTHNGTVISGEAVKVPFAGISDIPGPVTLLGLVPTDEGRGRWTMDPAYVAKRFATSKPTTVFVPF